MTPSALLGDTWLAHAGCTLLGEHVFRAVRQEFMIKHCLLKRLPQGAVAVPLADAVDFRIEHELEPIKHDELCARLARVRARRDGVDEIPLGAELVTVIRTMDCAAVSLALHDRLMARISGAKYGPLKTGGDFPRTSPPTRSSPSSSRRRSSASSGGTRRVLLSVLDS